MGTSLAPFSGISLTFHLLVLLAVWLYKAILKQIQKS